jgi:xylan 1,4-beta-xylosidase
MKRRIVSLGYCRKSAVPFVLTVLLALAGRAAGQNQPSPQPVGPPFPVTIRIDASKMIGTMQPVWRFFGYDEPNYTYMKDGLKLLGQLRSLSPNTVFIRTHNLLTSGDGQPALKWGSTGVYTEDEQGHARYNWTILDRIFDQGTAPIRRWARSDRNRRAASGYRPRF